VAKYDYAKITYIPKLDKGQASLEMVVLFEEGDDIDAVVGQLKDKVQARIAVLKTMSGQ